MSNLSRRSLVTCAAALPVLAVPVLASAAAGESDADAELIALGERLKAASANTAKLKRGPWEKWNAAVGIEDMIANQIFKMQANTRMGEGVRAAAALVLNDDVEGMHEIAEVLWEMAARADFRPPSDIAKKMRRRGVAIAKGSKQLDAKVVRARTKMIEADKRIDELFAQYPDTDCEDTPGFNDADRCRDKAIADLIKSPALSLEGFIGKAEAVADRRLIEDYQSHGLVATSLAKDILRYAGQSSDKRGRRVVRCPAYFNAQRGRPRWLGAL
jgi:hypothetical protein